MEIKISEGMKLKRWIKYYDKWVNRTKRREIIWCIVGDILQVANGLSERIIPFYNVEAEIYYHDKKFKLKCLKERIKEVHIYEVKD